MTKGNDQIRSNVLSALGALTQEVVSTQVYVYMFLHAYMSAYIYIYIYLYIYIYIYILYIYIYIMSVLKLQFEGCCRGLYMTPYNAGFEL